MFEFGCSYVSEFQRSIIHDSLQESGGSKGELDAGGPELHLPSLGAEETQTGRMVWQRSVAGNCESGEAVGSVLDGIFCLFVDFRECGFRLFVIYSVSFVRLSVKFVVKGIGVCQVLLVVSREFSLLFSYPFPAI